MFRDHGQSKKYYHAMIGWNARMDGLQAAVLRVKMRHIADWNEARRRHAEKYRELLAETDGLRVPEEAAWGKHVYHIYALRTSERDALMGTLAERDIHCGMHYPVPVHLQEAYSALGLGKGSFPVTERCADELISLPMFPELTDAQIEYVTSEIKRFVQR